MTGTFVAALARHAAERPESLALADGRVRLTWREASAWVEAAAGWLSGCGPARGAAVLGWLPNLAEWYLLRLACERAGLLWVPVPASQGVREMTSITAQVRPAVLATAARFRERDYVAEADALCAKTGLAPIRLAVPEDGLLALAGPPASADRATRPEEAAHALATSGSEGTPKLALYTLAAAAERGCAQAALLRIAPDDVVVALSAGTGPGKTPWLAAPMAGAAVVTVPLFRAQTAVDIIVRERATVVCGTPAQLAMMLSHLGRAGLASVRVWYAAGAVLDPALARDIEARTGSAVISAYGATDFGGWAAPDLDDPPDVRHRTVGHPRGGTEIRVVDPHGRDVPRGETGEIVGRGPCCVAGYVGDDGLAQARWRDGWFHTGDLGRFDERGHLVIVGRLRDLIIRGGENIGPGEIEALLRTHADIGEVAVVGVPDPVLGERVCACVVPRGSTSPRLEALREHLRQERLAHYKLPEQLVILPALPVVGDKIDRRVLAALAADAARA